MAHFNREWEDLGRSIQDAVDQAVSSQDYQKLNQTVRQVVNRAVDLGGDAVRKVVDSGRSVTKTTEKYTVVESKNLPALYGSTGGMTAKGIIKIVGGGVLSAMSLAAGIGTIALDILFGVSGGTMGAGMVLGCLVGGGLLIGSGVKTLNYVSRFKTYRKTMGEKTQCTLRTLARNVGKKVKFVRQELQKMIDDGLFLEGHLDKEKTRLITSHETYRLFEQSRLQLEQRQRLEAEEKAKQPAKPKQDPRVQEILDKGDAFVAEIRRCNDAIPGAVISEKISRMERIVEQIFDRAEAHPEVVPDLKKLMDYYLPMTVKLLNAYADMDAQSVQGVTIQNSKREIEGTLDTLNLAFEKLLDDLFADTAMDVSSDISVLNTLLAQEGLTEDGLSQAKNQNF